MSVTSWKGATAELAIALAARKHGMGVAWPLGGGDRYDLIFDIGTGFLRVQCKAALRRGDVLVVQCHSARRVRGGHAKRSYTAEEIDAIAAYSAELDRCYLLPMALCAGRPYVQLRLAPARNRQSAGIHWASAFEFETLDWSGLKGP